MWSSRASSHTQQTASRIDLELEILKFVVILSVVYDGAGADPYVCSESWTHPILLFTFFFFPTSNSVNPHTGKLRFVGIALSKSNLSFTKDVENCFTTLSLVDMALELNSAFRKILTVFSSRSAFFSSHFSVPIGRILYT